MHALRGSRKFNPGTAQRGVVLVQSPEMWSKQPMSRPYKRLSPLRSRLKKYLHRGWERAVFRTPHREGVDPDELNQDIIEGPGPTEELDATHFDALWERMHALAHQGLVKQTVVIDAKKRLDLDARHGSLRQKARDEQSLQKMMGHKKRLFRPDTSGTLLRELGLLNADGTMSRRHARKYKQVHHFVELCQPILAGLKKDKEEGKTLQILDLACGNSYLGLVLLEALHLQNIGARLLGIDINPQFVDASQDRANALKHLDARFLCTRIENANDPDPALQAPDFVVALHACDTATDQAIALCLQKKVPAFMCAPCCHAQVARQLNEKAVLPGLESLIEHGLFRRSYGELITDALRVAWIEAHGYEVAVVEFVTAEHSAKNQLIRAKRKGPIQKEKIEALRTQCRSLGLEPVLLFPSSSAR